MTSFKESGEELKSILKLERDPVAIKWSLKEPKNVEKENEKSRFCVKLIKASKGEIFYSTAEEEECHGGLRHSGMKNPDELPRNMKTGTFLVSGGVHKNISAVQRSWKNNQAVPPDIFQAVIFAPVAKAEFEPDVIFLICSAQQAMLVLHANAYDSGSHGLGADAGPICSSMAASPYVTGKVTYGFGDIGSRTHADIKPEEVMVSIPASDLERIINNLEEMKNKTFFKDSL
ncbi:MAG: DUF169 domain-containing protein [Methanobacterium sp.]